ncbi:GntR family transcriptional regulator [Amaricoccus solimangrovi]|uniref:GntR family transcriptional regulator n=1 Tax=Amaricoccus solimangrovi TaxID=2589815 RepID=A0A501WFN1_9RHOB|nr:GntR family transcriptional regulator [Amaricoccus solimangrovi]TPE46894.1 GntR family transcriptional regulator [Amaricoccus solimangrovi]
MPVDLSPAHPRRSGAPSPLRRTSASLQLHDLLRGRIISLDLAPGAPLSRVELAEEYGVSQTPVRDALRKLEQEGLVFVYPQSRTEVTRIDLDQARETQFLRLSLELEIARRLATSPDRGFVPVVARILRQQKAALELDADLARFKVLDLEFHQAFFTAAGVANLWPVVQERSGHIDRLRTLNLPDPGKALDILAVHSRIFDAITAGEAGAAEAAVREHLSGTLAAAEAIREKYPEYF